MNKIRTSRDLFPAARRQGHLAYYTGAAKGLGHKTDGQAIQRGVVAEARINHGRWIADCPFCVGAEAVDPEEPYFVCLSCGNFGTNLSAKRQGEGKLIEVQFPSQGKRLQIERILAARPAMALRNWASYEDIPKLIAENILLRCVVPEEV